MAFQLSHRWRTDLRRDDFEAQRLLHINIEHAVLRATLEYMKAAAQPIPAPFTVTTTHWRVAEFEREVIITIDTR